MSEEQIRELAGALWSDDVRLVGSTYICGAGADVDYIVKVHNLDSTAFQAAGFCVEGSEHYGSRGGFCSLRKGNVNVILVCNETLFCDWIRAAEVCRALYLRHGFLDKKDRVAIHRVIMDHTEAGAAYG